MQRYNPKDIEPKWQAKWEADKIYQASEDPAKPKKYILEYFPYPSGAAMHVGHVRNYAIGDALSRYNRMQGYNVLHPMGWDAFGLPAENYAIKNKISPRQAIDANTQRFKQQLTQMGFGYDWSREIDSTDPAYYRWTQWFFLLLFKRGLAYQKESLQWWCPHDKTVLANEQVENGVCWRCGNQVEKKALKQWFFKIRDYADRLDQDLDNVDWSDAIKSMQRNWIGRSKGAEIDFPVAADENYVLLHGYSGSSQDAFFPWVHQQLENRGAAVYTPDLPDSDQPDAVKQAAFVGQHHQFDAHTVLLGHSYGAVSALRVVESLAQPIKRLVLVAGFAQPGFKDEGRPFESTTDWKFDFGRIKANVKEIIILRPSNDHAVPAERAEYLADKLGGRIVDFTAEASHATGEQEPVVLEQLAPQIKVFTTRPDTLFGATFMVLAPEHPMVQRITTAEQKSAVQTYVKATQAKSDIQRQETDRDKTGVFTGAYAVNPANGEEIPVWIADYVLYGYGTGAIMAVPAHDERDFAFAQKFNLSIRQVVAERFIHTDNNHRAEAPTVPRRVVCLVVKHPNEDKILVAKPVKSSFWSPVMGGIDEGETPEQAARRELREEAGYHDIKQLTVYDEVLASEFYAQHKGENRIAYVTTVSVELNSLQADEVSEAEKAEVEPVWVSPAELLKLPMGAGAPEIYQLARGERRDMVHEGRLINSGQFDGQVTSDAREAITAWLAERQAGEERVNYKIRDWLISRQRYWGAPIPIVWVDAKTPAFYGEVTEMLPHLAVTKVENGKEYSAIGVPPSQLPVQLPELDNYEPDGSGRSPLAKAKDWAEIWFNIETGEAVPRSQPKPEGERWVAGERETDTMDGFACSSWYFLRFADPHNQDKPFDVDKAKFWAPVDDYIGGAEHAVMHLLYARMWTKVMFDEGMINFNEPFKTLRNQGMILAPDGQKMSKSKGNTIEPDSLIEQGYGADSIRVMELFIGPWNQMANWSVEGMGGSYRFLQRIWTLVQEFQASIDDAASQALNEAATGQLRKQTHHTIKRVTEDLQTMGFNTAIAALMELVNDLYKLKAAAGYGNGSDEWRIALESLLQLLSPFAPHVAEELWSQLGHETSIHISDWPKHAERYLVEDQVTVVVQVNGKLRAQLQVVKDADQADVEAAAKADRNVATHLEAGAIIKTIFVPNKLVNFVVK